MIDEDLNHIVSPLEGGSHERCAAVMIGRVHIETKFREHLDRFQVVLAKMLGIPVDLLRLRIRSDSTFIKTATVAFVTGVQSLL